MTFLELCQWVHQEAQLPGNGPSSVTGQTGQSRDIVRWVANAWKEIQLMEPNWLWMRGEFTLTTVENQIAYTPTAAGIASRFLSWDRNSMRVYETTLTANTSTELPWLPYEMYRDYYLTNTQAPGRPVIHSMKPDRSLLLGPAPNAAGYTVVGEYNKTPQALTANADTPEMPEAYHELIGYAALMKYARAESAGEIYMDAEKERNRYLARLRINQLPAVELGEALE